MKLPNCRLAGVVGAVGMMALVYGCAQAPVEPVAEPAVVQATTREDFRALSLEVYTYAYPLVLADVTREVMSARTPVNTFAHRRTFPDPDFTDVASPDAGALCSIAWLDLSKGPVVLSVPETQGRYYVLQLMDGWSNVFASLGKRTTGTHAGNYAIVPPDWSGALPAGVREIRSPTTMAWISAHVQTNGKGDYGTVRRLQNGFRLTPLAAWPHGRSALAPLPTLRPAAVDTETSPVEQVAAMDAQSFFSRFAALLPANPPVSGDDAMMQKVRAMGIRPGAPFVTTVLEPDTARAIQEGATRALDRIVAQARGGRAQAAGQWLARSDLGRYGSDYDRRATTAWLGLGTGLAEDTMVFRVQSDAQGRTLNGRSRYVIRFDKGELPPAQAFWTLSMYDESQQLVANPIQRYAIHGSDRLRRNRDGSVDIIVQNEPPPRGKRDNWLPAPAGPFNLMLRVHWPRQAALDGGWTPPAVLPLE